MKHLKSLFFAFAGVLLLSSCFTYSVSIGSGAQGNEKTKSWNHYLIAGLAPVGVSDPKEMAGEAENYDVQIQRSFVNGLVGGLTFGLYTPTTTTVTK
ncbi:MAG: hypothetical protein ACJAQ4_000487 [Cryomorphaceae bacterium]|jgi:hypothetical protein